MEIKTAKILIIFGLLILTLFAGLLPFLCLKLTDSYKRKSKRRKQFCREDCDVNYGSAHVDCQESILVSRNDSVLTTASEVPRRKSRKKLVISVLNCFAGGIFLGTSFIELLPEIRKCFYKLDIKWPVLHSTVMPRGNETENVYSDQDQMPIAEMIVVGGLFLILCVEQGAHAWIHHRGKKKLNIRGNSAVGLRMSALGEGDIERSEEDSTNVSDSEKSHHDHSAIRSLILVATLSAHSLLEGVAIGLQEQLQSTVAIFIAVLLHKSLMAFSMGTNLVQSRQTVKKIVVACLIFSIASPIGIGIGMIIQLHGGEERSTDLTNAILQAIATGTFLYITFFEVLVKEFESHGNHLAKIIALFVGYGSVLGTFFASNG